MAHKRLTRMGMGILLLGIVVSQASFAQVKIGYINSQKMLALFPRALEAQRQLQNEYNAVDKELKSMEQDLVAKQQEYSQQSLLLSEQKKQEKQQEMQDLYVRIQQYRQDKNTELTQRQEELMKPVLDELDSAIQKMGTEEGYDFIFDSIQGNLLFAQKKYDVTDKLLIQLGITPPAEDPEEKK